MLLCSLWVRIEKIHIFLVVPADWSSCVGWCGFIVFFILIRYTLVSKDLTIDFHQNRHAEPEWNYLDNISFLWIPIFRFINQNSNYRMRERFTYLPTQNGTYLSKWTHRVTRFLHCVEVCLATGHLRGSGCGNVTCTVEQNTSKF